MTRGYAIITHAFILGLMLSPMQQAHAEDSVEETLPEDDARADVQTYEDYRAQGVNYFKRGLLGQARQQLKLPERRPAAAWTLTDSISRRYIVAKRFETCL